MSSLLYSRPSLFPQCVCSEAMDSFITCMQINEHVLLVYIYMPLYFIFHVRTSICVNMVIVFNPMLSLQHYYFMHYHRHKSSGALWTN